MLIATGKAGHPTEPLTPADSLKDSGISPVSSQGSFPSPHLDIPRSVIPNPQPLTPQSGPNSALECRPPSQDLFSSHPPTNRNLSFNDIHTQSRPSSPLKQNSYAPILNKPVPPQQPSSLPSLQVKIPTHSERNRRSPSGSSLREITSAGSERLRRQPSNNTSPEEKKIFGLFRRKSTKSISKKDITSPILERSEKLPTIPGVPIALLQATSPQNLGVDGMGKRLPTGPAPPRPARPDTMTDLMDQIKANGNILPPKPTAPEVTEPEPSLPAVQPQEVREEPREEQQTQDRTSDTPACNAENQTSDDRPSQNTLGLPQISEEGDAPHSPVDHNPPPSVWSNDHLQQSNGSRHAPSESVSSSGSRFGFDDRSISSVSSPPTSSVSSFQFKDFADESKSAPSISSEASASSLRIPPSPRAANFSRPRGPTITSSPLLQSSSPSPSPTGAFGSSTDGESPREVTPQDNSFDGPLQRDQPTLQPTLQAVSYQRPSPKLITQAFVKPPLPPMPEEPTTAAPMLRPNLSRSKSTATKGQCRGCKQEITGRSIKAADGQLTGRWHRECFVCKTCRGPFLKGDFYVLRNEPYCSHHYHVLNNSLCRYCHTGIEGRYFEIDGRRRFHTGCFFCAECRRPLAGDYFEMGNRFHCEIDAQRFHQRATHLNPGRRFPERRTTKLMMM